MLIRLLCVGKLRQAPLREVCDDFAKRLTRYGPFEVDELKAAQSKTPAASMEDESARILSALKAASAGHVWVLDEKGASVTSPGLAERLTQLELRGTRRLTVLLGGAYGMTQTVRSAGEKISLSPLTFNHELCRVIALEQLYRARTIQRGEPYHHA